MVWLCFAWHALRPPLRKKRLSGTNPPIPFFSTLSIDEEFLVPPDASRGAAHLQQQAHQKLLKTDHISRQRFIQIPGYSRAVAQLAQTAGKLPRCHPRLPVQDRPQRLLQALSAAEELFHHL